MGVNDIQPYQYEPAGRPELSENSPGLDSDDQDSHVWQNDDHDDWVGNVEWWDLTTSHNVHLPVVMSSSPFVLVFTSLDSSWS